ncbi:MAG TPA: archease [Terriglobales bacterium]|nr:archease [Terriglobales bacterium]
MTLWPEVEGVSGAEEVEHTADRAFRIRGRNLRQLLERAAQVLVVLEGEPLARECFVQRVIEVEGTDRETLLVNWLNEILYLEQTHQEIYHHCLLQDVTDHHLRAQLYGRPADHNIASAKAVTFHNLEVKESSEGLEATVVVDV